MKKIISLFLVMSIMTTSLTLHAQSTDPAAAAAQAKADKAMRALPDPDDEERGPLAKVRDAMTGG